MQVKKKFNHTALYTGILSSGHSHLHMNNALGSTAPRHWMLIKQGTDSGLQGPRGLWSGSVLPRGCCPLGGYGTAQVWSQLKADKTRHALASLFVFSNKSYYLCFQP